MQNQLLFHWRFHWWCTILYKGWKHWNICAFRDLESAHPAIFQPLQCPCNAPAIECPWNNFLFMNDNARPHRAHLVNNMLQEAGLERMDWTSRSPNLNPETWNLEHAWDTLGRCLANYPMPSRTLLELEASLKQERQRIPQVLLDNLILSMPHHYQCVLTVLGDHFTEQSICGTLVHMLLSPPSICHLLLNHGNWVYISFA